MVSSLEAADDKRNLYSPEPFLFDIDFEPNLHNLNSPSTSDVIGKYVSDFNSLLCWVYIVDGVKAGPTWTPSSEES